VRKVTDYSETLEFEILTFTQVLREIFLHKLKINSQLNTFLETFLEKQQKTEVKFWKSHKICFRDRQVRSNSQSCHKRQTQFENISDCESGFTETRDTNKNNNIKLLSVTTLPKDYRLRILTIFLTESVFLRTASLKAMEAPSLEGDKTPKTKQQRAALPWLGKGILPELHTQLLSVKQKIHSAVDLHVCYLP